MSEFKQVVCDTCGKIGKISAPSRLMMLDGFCENGWAYLLTPKREMFWCSGCVNGQNTTSN